MTKTFTFNSKIKVKAIIKFNSNDGTQVVYYRQGGRFFKMLDAKRIVPLCPKNPSTFYHQFMSVWSKRIPIQFVYPDEQVLCGGVPVGIKMDTFDTSYKNLSVTECGQEYNM